MASSSRLTSPPLSPPRRTAGVHYPATPDTNLRNRWRPTEEPPDSPGSETASSTNYGLFRSSTSGSLAHAGGSEGNLINLSLGNFTHRVHIRADPAITTCFDPSDKELYNLWVPRR